MERLCSAELADYFFRNSCRAHSTHRLFCVFGRDSVGLSESCLNCLVWPTRAELTTSHSIAGLCRSDGKPGTVFYLLLGRDPFSGGSWRLIDVPEAQHLARAGSGRKGRKRRQFSLAGCSGAVHLSRQWEQSRIRGAYL